MNHLEFELKDKKKELWAQKLLKMDLVVYEEAIIHLRLDNNITISLHKAK